MTDGIASHLTSLQWIAPTCEAIARLTEPGVYQLYVQLSQPMRIETGKLGAFDFPAGCYVYTGSALSGIGARVSRHLRTEKRRHWHIDYLLEQARIRTVAVLPTRDRLECDLHRLTMERLHGQIVVARFGSSDCRCAAHLGYLGALECEDAKATDLLHIPSHYDSHSAQYTTQD